MKNKIINQLTSQEIKNPITGDFITIPIDQITIETGAIQQLPDFFAKLPKNDDQKWKVAVVSDDNTHFAAGAEIERILCKHCQLSSIVLPDRITASTDNIEILNAYTITADILIAVGGGTINDLCKYSSFKSGKKYISVPTCPSVNGFSSANASLEEDGVKKSFSAHLPTAIFADTDILVQAPQRLIISGLGDSLARPTAQSDWLLSHHLLGTDYNPICFDILKEAEEKTFKNAAKLLENDYEAIKSLMELLILSGLSMYIAKSSEPASQAEHMISHYIEMMHCDDVPHTFHGEQIAITSIAMAKIQNKILEEDKLQLHPILHSEKPLLKHFGEEKGKEFLEQCSQKELNGKRLSEVNDILNEKWSTIKQEIKSITIDPEEMENIIIAIKGPYTYKHLAWEHDYFKNAIEYAPYTRNRFTFLDLAMGIKESLEN